MYVGVIHTVKDKDFWVGMTRDLDPAGFPAGLELVATGTSADVDRAICLWRAPSVEQLQATLDTMTGEKAVNDCFPVPEEFALTPGASNAQGASV